VYLGNQNKKKRTIILDPWGRNCTEPELTFGDTTLKEESRPAEKETAAFKFWEEPFKEEEKQD